MSDSDDQSSGFNALLKRPQSQSSPSKAGSGIAEVKSESQASFYRDLVKRQMMRRKKSTRPVSPVEIQTQIVSRNVSQECVKTPIDNNAQIDPAEASLPSQLESETICVETPIGESTHFDLCANLPIAGNTHLILHGVFSAIGQNTHELILSGCVNLPIGGFTQSFRFIDVVTPELSDQFVFHALILSIFDSKASSFTYYTEELIENSKSSNLSSVLSNIIRTIESVSEFIKAQNDVCVNLPIAESTHSDSLTSYTSDDQAFSPIGVFTHLKLEQIATRDDSAKSSIGVFTHTQQPNFSKIKITKNYTRVPRTIFSLLHKISKADFHIYLYLFRLSYGFQSSDTNIPINKFTIEKKLTLNRRTVTKCLDTLTEQGLIEPFTSQRGQVHYRVFHPNETGLSTDTNYPYFEMTNDVFEMPVKSKEFVAYLLLYHYAYGEESNCTTKLLTSDLARMADIHIRNFQDSIRSLIECNLIKRISEVMSSQGIEYRVNLPSDVWPEKCTKEPIAKNTQRVDAPIGKFASQSTKSAIGKNTQPILNHDKTISYTASAKPPIGDFSTINNNIIKSSSSDADLFFEFLKTSFEDQTNIFPISKTVAQKYLDSFGLETCKKHITKLKRQILEADSSIGLWIDSLKNPQNYPELEAQDKQQIKQQTIVAEAKEKSFIDDQKKHFDSLIGNFWNQLSSDEQQKFIEAKRSQLGQGGGDLKIPDVVITKSAMEFAFWSTSQQRWNSLNEMDRTQKLNAAKNEIIKRVYVHKDEKGQMRVPETLPKTDFSSSLGEWAEKLAMISVHKDKR